MNNILAAQVLHSHLAEIPDGAYKRATEIAIEALYEDAHSDWLYHYKDKLPLHEYLGMASQEEVDRWVHKT